MGEKNDYPVCYSDGDYEDRVTCGSLRDAHTNLPAAILDATGSIGPGDTAQLATQGLRVPEPAGKGIPLEQSLNGASDCCDRKHLCRTGVLAVTETRYELLRGKFPNPVETGPAIILWVESVETGRG